LRSGRGVGRRPDRRDLSSPYRLERVRAFLDPEAGTAVGWQSAQSLVAPAAAG